LFNIALDFNELCQKGIKCQYLIAMLPIISNISQIDVNMFTKPQTAVKHEIKPQTPVEEDNISSVYSLAVEVRFPSEKIFSELTVHHIVKYFRELVINSGVT